MRARPSSPLPLGRRGAIHRVLGRYGSRPLVPLALLTALALCVAVGCGRGGSARGTGAAPPAATGADARLPVVAGIPPHAYIVERVGGDHVTVGTILPPGQSPHTYEPTPHQVAALTDARAFFLVGMPFETAMARKAGPMAPGLLIADARDASIVMRMMTADEVGADRDDRDTGHEHAGGEPDPHIWLAPRNAEPMAEHARKVLTELDPANASDYEANRARLCEDIDAADARIRAVLAPFRGGAVLVYHPAFGYFTDAYGLRQVPVEVEGKEPSPRQLAALAARARAESARVLFVQPQFAIATAEALAREIGAAVVPLDDLGRDYVANLETIAAKIEEALATPPEGRRANDQPAGS